MTTPTLETERLILRPFRETDAKDVFECWESDPEVAQFMFWTSHNDIAKTKDWIRFELEQIEKSDWYRFALVLKATDELIGTALIYYEEEVSCWEIGYNLGKKYWGNGYTTEAMTRVLQFAKENLNVSQIVGRYAKENPVSGKIMQKLGFKFEKEIPYECNEGTIMREGIQCRLIMDNLLMIGAYQFAVTGEIRHNFETVKRAILKARQQGVRLLVLPECALTGYPPRDIESAAIVKFNELDKAYTELQNIVNDSGIYVLVGTITKEADNLYNSAMVFVPNGERIVYHKRALWGWDSDNFTIGNKNGLIKVDEWKIGIRICFEVRFPEFFREMYKEHTDLNVVLFYDVSDYDDLDRYDLIKGHLRTRAVENVTHTLSVNSIYPYQTAPTILYDRSGCSLCELKRNEEDLLVYRLDKTLLDFGEEGRKSISDKLINCK